MEIPSEVVTCGHIAQRKTNFVYAQFDLCEGRRLDLCETCFHNLQNTMVVGVLREAIEDGVRKGFSGVRR